MSKYQTCSDCPQTKGEHLFYLGQGEDAYHKCLLCDCSDFR